jgi:nucleotide-binding universal stress UspA family protein
MLSFGFDRILIPTDMSDFARLALRYGALFRERLGSALTLLYADEFYFPVDLLEVPMGYYLENAPETRIKLEKRLREHVEETIGGQGVDAKIVQDAPARGITAIARDIEADLIIMGTHGRHGWRRAILGSVTENVLHATSAPLLTVTPHRMDARNAPAFGRILCPVNFTRVAREALEYAGALAQAFDAELTVMYVAEGIEPPLVPELETAFRMWLDPQVRDRSRFSHVLVRNGDPAARVLNAASELGADLIVIGAQHKFFSDATVIGTTTQRITRFATCPVLTVVRPAIEEIYGHDYDEEREREEALTAR